MTRSGHPRLIGADSGPWPLHDVAAARALERGALQPAGATSLMERAGLSVARLARALAPQARRLELWCGPGNNGGDGLVAARHLHGLGLQVQVIQIGAAARLPPDAAQAWQGARAAGVSMLSLADADAGAEPPELVIDALLGLGANRAPDGEIGQAIARIGRRGAPVLAVDLPSGLHADSGRRLGTEAVRADATLTLLSLKPGLFTGQGRELAGAVWFDDLGGVAGAGPAPCAWLSGPARHRAAPHAAHKGSQGDVLVIGGARGMTGAAWLAARAALAAGAGRIYLSLLDSSAPWLDPGRPELMVRPALWADAGTALLDEATVVCGCGGGAEVREALPAVLGRSRRLVLDADALNALAAEPALASLLRGRAGRDQATVLTPHPLEAARLLGSTRQAVQDDRLGAAQELAQRYACVAVLKGSGTVVATAGGLCFINSSGNGALASAGTGDVLAGWLGGLWAQTTLADPAALARDAVWQHGWAADRYRSDGGVGPLRAGDLVEALRAPA